MSLIAHAKDLSPPFFFALLCKHDGAAVPMAQLAYICSSNLDEAESSVETVDSIYTDQPSGLASLRSLVLAITNKHSTNALTLQRRVNGESREIPGLLPARSVQDVGLYGVEDTMEDAGAAFINVAEREQSVPQR